MATTVKEMLAAANEAVPRIEQPQALEMMEKGDVLVVDVRDAPELQETGKIKGALNVSRGMLEFRADPGTPYYNEAFKKEIPVILYCASGGRAVLGGKALLDLGYGSVFNLGSFKDWLEAGLDTEPA